ncbi:keratin, type II cytoskeletal 5-like [Platysternon megacephalum]|uniref:Keratin, type II cytoskeletal 5-like n=1 Tax=Platysternon megacephalum TaxID=55544 RepID=A0A4D9ED77_9SAUR|nr:keratin, type II cytoskeletal 5-like [Platysternon megacephalum]
MQIEGKKRPADGVSASPAGTTISHPPSYFWAQWDGEAPPTPKEQQHTSEIQLHPHPREYTNTTRSSRSILRGCRCPLARYEGALQSSPASAETATARGNAPLRAAELPCQC